MQLKILKKQNNTQECIVCGLHSDSSLHTKFYELENNIIYTIIKFKKQFKKYSKKELFFGPILLKNKNDLFNKNIQNIIDKNNNILKMLPKRMFIKKIKIKYNNIKLKKEMK